MSKKYLAAESYIQAMLVAKAAWREHRARLSFSQKLAILDELKAASTTFASHRNQTSVVPDAVVNIGRG
jgi:hypothetical protein